MSHPVGMAVRLEHVLKLRLLERVMRVEEIGDSIAGESADLPVSRRQADELDRRLRRHQKAPDRASAWPAVRRRIKGKLAHRRK